MFRLRQVNTSFHIYRRNDWKIVWLELWKQLQCQLGTRTNKREKKEGEEVNWVILYLGADFNDQVFSRFKQVVCFYFENWLTAMYTFVLFFGLNPGVVCEWTLMMISTQAVETSVTTTDSSPSQDYAHSGDQITRSLCSVWYLWSLWFWFVDASMKTNLSLNLARHHINLSKFVWCFKYKFCVNCTK